MQISGFDSALQSAHKQAVAAAAGVDEVNTSLHAVGAQLNATAANFTAHKQRDDQLLTRIREINDTLSAEMVALRARIDVVTVSCELSTDLKV